MSDEIKNPTAQGDGGEAESADRWTALPEYPEMMVRFRDEYVKEEDAVLDLGCRSGHNARIVSEKAVTIMGIDSSAERVEEAKANVPTGFFRKGDIRRIYEIGPFHAMIASFCIAGLTPEATTQPFIEKVAALLVPDGVLYLSFRMKKEAGPASISTASDGALVFVYHDLTQITGWLTQNHLSIVETYRSECIDVEGDMTTDISLFIRKK